MAVEYLTYVLGVIALAMNQESSAIFSSVLGTWEILKFKFIIKGVVFYNLVVNQIELN